MSELIHGDGWTVLPQLKRDGRQFSVVVADPPYSSGGMFRGDRAADPVSKYCLDTKDVKRTYLSFGGDNMDQRAWFRFTVEWMRDAYELLTPGGMLFSFIDWRQLPTMADAVQCAGLVWRGIMPWNKTAAVRPSRGYFRNQCEYIIHATKGTLGKEQTREGSICAEGFFCHPIRGVDKHHPTGKPVELMADLLEILPPGSTVLDPFGGSGSTAVAAHLQGLDATLIEKEEHWHKVASLRLEHARKGQRLTFNELQALLPGISPDDDEQPELFPKA